ncbi:MAG: T9SS type A sorting domain-containing protein [Flavobacteriales bacterium]|jgi:hypothetical protein|nr:T9SS type A sorting domain-containing protein [Flavobacteriales bacterium]
MNTKTLLSSIVGLSTIALFSFTKNIETIGVYNHFDALYSGGADPGKTGAPGEFNCTQCHGGFAIPNSSVTNITFSGANNKYIPGSTYTITVALPTAPSPKNGFEIVALRNSDDTNIGSFTITDATNTQLRIGGGRTYVTHTSSGNGLTTWNFDWVAPTNPEGDITFYVAANQSDNNGTTSGDEIHLKQLVIQEDASSDVIEQNSIVAIDNSLKIIRHENWINTSLFVEKSQPITTTVMNLNGQVIYTNNTVLTAGENNLNPIDFSQYSRGIYMINYTIDGQIISRKVFI